MKARLILFALSFALMFGATAQTFTQNNADGVTIQYSVTTDGHVKVIANDYSGRVAVPESVTYEGTTYVVNEVGTAAFNGCNMTYIKMPSTIEKIGNTAFNCNTLDTLNFLSQNPPRNMSGAAFNETAIRMMFGIYLIKTVTVQVPSGRLASYRRSGWGYVPNLTSPTAVPLAMGTQPQIATNIIVDGKIWTVSNYREEAHYNTFNYEVGDTIEFFSTINNGDSIFMGWDNDDVLLGQGGYYMIVTHADTIRPIVDIAGYETLAVNVVSTPVKINGLMSYMNGVANYYVPAGGSSSPLYANGLWITGIDDDDLVCASVSRFNCGDFVPGPIKTDGSCGSDIETKRAFNRVWSVSRAEIDDFIAHVGHEGYSIPENILTWPGNGGAGYAEQLAPYYDADSDGVYNPRHGDYPLIRGDRMLFSIINDVSQHESTIGDYPMGLEIHVSAYAFDEPEDAALGHTVFLSYKVINRSSRTYRDVHFGQFIDFDLGYGYDDYIGCDVKRGLAYCYNGKESDGPGNGMYYGVPPAQGCAVLAGPTMDADGLDNYHTNNPLWHFTPSDENGNNAINGWGFDNGVVDDERIGMRRFMYYENSLNTIIGEPTVCTDYYNFLRGYWKNGQHITYGGNGYYYSDLECDFMFPNNTDSLHWGTNGVVPDNNADDWNESMMGNAPGDRRGVVSSGPVTVVPGEENSLDLAFTTGFSVGSAWGSVQVLQVLTDDVRRQFIRDTTYSGKPFTYMPYSAPIVGMESVALHPSVKVYPNPAGDRLTVALGDGAATDVEVYDVRGYRVMHVDNARGVVTLDLSALTKGLYVVRCGEKVTKVMKR